jgi:hypothetical protein
VYAFLANVVALIHLSFVLFAVFGGLLSIRWRRTAWIHIPTAVTSALAAVTGWICPLTPLENKFRVLAGETGYAGYFLDRYIFPILYPPGMTRSVQIMLGATLLTFNTLVSRHA